MVSTNVGLCSKKKKKRVLPVWHVAKTMSDITDKILTRGNKNGNPKALFSIPNHP